MDQGQASLTGSFKVYLNGAFFTNVALDSRVLLSSKRYYRDAQEAVKEGLREKQGWDYKDLSDQPRAQFPATGETQALFPDCFATKGGAPLEAEVRARVNSALAAIRNEAAVSVTVISAEVDFFDSAFGVLGVMLHVTPQQPPLSATRARHLVESVCEVLERDDGAFTPVLKGAVTEFRQGVCDVLGADTKYNGVLLASPWFHVTTNHRDDQASSAGRTPDEERGLGPARVGELLWIHRTYILASESCDEANDVIVDLLPETRAKETPSGKTSLVAGLGSSAISVPTFDADVLGGGPFKNLLMLMDVQWAYIATLIEIDRTLFLRLNYIGRQEQTEEHTEELKLVSERVLALYDRVRLFRAALESFLIDLGGEGRRAWERMAKVQSLRHLEATLDDKLSALRETCEHSLAKLARRADASSRATEKRIEYTLYVFTAFSVVASIIAIGTFPFADDLGPPVPFRVVVVLVLMSAVAAAALGARRRREVDRRSGGEAMVDKLRSRLQHAWPEALAAKRHPGERASSAGAPTRSTEPTTNGQQSYDSEASQYAEAPRTRR